MCNAYPRPRCSHHTFEKLQDELQSLQALMLIAGNHKRVPAALGEKIARQEFRVEVAQRQYNCTKRGMEELKQKLAATEPSKDRLEHSYYQRSWDNAQEDSLNHKLAGALFDAYKNNVNPAQDMNVIRAQQKRNGIAAQIAYVSNEHPTSAQIGKLERQYNAFDKEQRRAIKKFLLRARGITRPGIASNPLKSTERLYTFVPSSEFGHLAKEFPHGCYAEITDISEDPEGNYQGLIEGIKPTTLPSELTFLSQKTG